MLNYLNTIGQALKCNIMVHVKGIHKENFGLLFDMLYKLCTVWELTIAFAKEHCDISIMDKGAATKAPPSVQMVVEALAGDLEWRDTNDSTSGFTRCGASS